MPWYACDFEFSIVLFLGSCAPYGFGIPLTFQPFANHSAIQLEIDALNILIKTANALSIIFRFVYFSFMWWKLLSCVCDFSYTVSLIKIAQIIFELYVGVQTGFAVLTRLVLTQILHFLTEMCVCLWFPLRFQLIYFNSGVFHNLRIRIRLHCQMIYLATLRELCSCFDFSQTSDNMWLMTFHL